MLYCCDKMEYFTENHCDNHNNPFDCPDYILHYEPTTQTYGIVIHDGTESWIQILYCPWCGNELNKEQKHMNK